MKICCYEISLMKPTENRYSYLVPKPFAEHSHSVWRQHHSFTHQPWLQSSLCSTALGGWQLQVSAPRQVFIREPRRSPIHAKILPSISDSLPQILSGPAGQRLRYKCHLPQNSSGISAKGHLFHRAGNDGFSHLYRGIW